MIDDQRVIADVRALPPFPRSAARITNLTRDPHSRPADFEAVLRTDGALTANVLRLANSPFFGCAGRIGSVRQAIAMLGTKRLVELALAGGFAQVLPAELDGYALDSRSYWRHSVAVAMLTETLAKDLGFDEPTAFASGLLHDIGKLVTRRYLADHHQELTAELSRGTPLAHAETEVLGVDHAAVGARIAQRWKLPRGLCTAIRWHHEPLEIDDLVTDLVHVADAVAHSFGLGADIGGLARRIEPEVVRRRGLTEMLVSSAMATTLADIEAMTDLLG